MLVDITFILYLYFIYDASTNHENRISALESGGEDEWTQIPFTSARDSFQVFVNESRMVKIIYTATYTSDVTKKYLSSEVQYLSDEEYNNFGGSLSLNFGDVSKDIKLSTNSAYSWPVEFYIYIRCTPSAYLGLISFAYLRDTYRDVTTTYSQRKALEGTYYTNLN